MDNPEDKAFENCIARLGEHFTDYLIIARAKNGDTFNRASDRNWSYGAAARLITGIDNVDYINKVEETQDGSR